MTRDDPTVKHWFDQVDFDKLADEIASAVPTDDPDDPDTEMAASAISDRFERFIEIVSEASPGVSRREIVSFLLNSANGRKVAEHLASITKKEEPVMDRTEQLRSIAKDFGVHRLAKLLIDDDNAHGISEFEFHKLMNDEAQKTKRDGETPDQAFARFYSDDANIDLRKAITIVKSVPNFMSIEATQVGGDDAFDTSVADSSAKAMAKLNEMAEEQRKRSPTLTVAQAFARVFEDPANKSLAAAAHRRPSATTSYAMPR